MTANAFDMVRKIRHLPGLQLTATIDPTQVTKRVKNAACKMLRTGVLMGGYASQSRLLAEQMQDTFNQPGVGRAHSWGAFITDASMLPDEGRAHLVELLEASRLIEHANNGNNGNNPNRYINDRYNQMIVTVNERRTGRVSFGGYNKAVNQQILEMVSSYRAPERVKADEALADRLNNPEPFTINLYA